MNTLFNQEWFIQSLVETIIRNYKFTFAIDCYNHQENPKLVCNIFQINKKCHNVGLKHSFFVLKACDNYFELQDEDQIEIDENGFPKKWKPTLYNKKYVFGTRKELDENLDKVVKENNINVCDWFVEFSCYRYYRMRDGSKRRIRIYFRFANLNNHKDLYNVFTDSDDD